MMWVPPRGAEAKQKPSNTELPGRFAVDGKVVDAEGVPVDGAHVQIDSIPPREVVTDEDGTFRFGGLADRTYLLEARSENQVSAITMRRMGPARDPVTLVLSLGLEIDVDIVDEVTRAPISGARITMSAIGAQRTETTSASGRATFQGLRVGAFQVVVWPPEASSTAIVQTTLVASAVPGQRAQETIALPRGAVVSGTVARHGVPIADAVVITEAMDTSYRSEQRYVAGIKTDADGRWRMSLAPGQYRFHAHHGAASSNVILHDGATAHPGVVLDLAGAAPLHGRVRTSDGTPAPFATVMVRLHEATTNAPTHIGLEKVAAFATRDEVRTEVVCDEEGRFMLHDLPLREIQLRAVARGASSAAMTVDGARQTASEVELTLDQTALIRGVVMSTTGQPVAHAQLALDAQVQMLEPIADITDEKGQFQLSGLPPGHYKLRAAAPGADARALESNPGIDIEPGDAPITIFVQALATLKGSVRFANGGVPKSFEIEVDSSIGILFTTIDGQFELASIVPGTHQIEVSGPDFLTLVREVEVGPAAVTDTGALAVQHGRALRGRVLESGRGVAGATVIVGRGYGGGGRLEWNLTERRFGARRAITDENGWFSIEGLEPDTRCAIAEHRTLGRSTAVALAAPGENQAPVELVLQRTGGVRGHVRRKGQGIAATLTATPTNTALTCGVQFSIPSSEAGEYELLGLAPGRYSLSAMADESLGTKMNSELTIVAGSSATLDLEVPHGANLEMDVRAGTTPPPDWVLIIPGEYRPAIAEELWGLIQDNREGAVWSTVASIESKGDGGSDRFRFRDLPDGHYTMCFARFEHPPEGSFTCRSLDLRPGTPHKFTTTREGS